MPKDEDNKIFDVTRPSRVSPPATSRPIIVGHRPMADDPMVVADSPKEEPHHNPIVHSDVPAVSHEPVKKPISVFHADEHKVDDAEHVAVKSDVPTLSSEPEAAPEHPEGNNLHGFETHPSEPKAEHEEPDQHSAGPAGPYQPHFTPVNDLINESKAPEENSHSGHAEESSFVPETHQDNNYSHAVVGDSPFNTSAGAGPRRSWSKMLGIVFGIILIVVIALYFAVDGGYIKSNIKLPFHILNKQKSSSTPAPTVSPASSSPMATSTATNSPALPTGFTAYKATAASLAFDYPTAWGAPTVSVDPGFSKRGGTNKTDGTHAFLIDFATNKDVELAATSSKYLPATRTNATYYDYLQWCVGTNDSKIYKQTLHFTTASGVDTPSTVTCDEGPLDDATKLPSDTTDPISTIVQLKTKGTDGTILGDVYTKNLLKNPTVTVLRVKDAASTNSVAIKQLLDTVQDLAAPTTAVPTP